MNDDYIALDCALEVCGKTGIKASKLSLNN